MERSSLRVVSLFDAGRDRPVVVAHRGDSYHAPENTLEAAWLGHDCGADLWELDVQLTRDGVAVVMHDESLLRTTNVDERFTGDARTKSGFRVADFTWAEIRTLDAGSWFVKRSGGPRSARWFQTLGRLEPSQYEHFCSGRVRVPSLEEALIFTKELDWLVNVELKSHTYPRRKLLETVLQTLQSTDTADRALLSSFDHTEAALASVPNRRSAPIRSTFQTTCSRSMRQTQARVTRLSRRLRSSSGLSGDGPFPCSSTP
jgi:glycerophosphoryl diester phosphodiesterase